MRVIDIDKHNELFDYLMMVVGDDILLESNAEEFNGYFEVHLNEREDTILLFEKAYFDNQ